MSEIPASDSVRITDVAPRDGLQNETAVIDTADKCRLVKLLSVSGVQEVEVSSFVSPKWIPQLADAAEVFACCGPEKPENVVWSALVPNERGMLAALDVNQRAGKRLIDKIAVFTAASEGFARQNTNATIDETLERFKPVIARAEDNDLSVRGYVSCAIRCPVDGDVDPQQVARVAARLADLGVDEIDLGDTIGAGTPDTVRPMLDAVLSALGAHRLKDLTLHFHDTYGKASANVLAGLEFGVRSFDGAAAGLGGCPYASTDEQRAPGNISTTTLVDTVHNAGYRTTVDLAALAEASACAQQIIPTPQP